METLELIRAGAVIAILILSLGIHEAAHALVADLCGDSTAREEGRLTLNPIAHIDPFMTLIVPLFLWISVGFLFGGAKPVPVNPSRLRHPLRDMSLVALAGPASNILLAIVLMVLFKASLHWGGYDREALMPSTLSWGVIANVFLAVFNMIPIPPLDGSRVMAYLLPSNLRAAYARLESFGLLIIILVIYMLPGSLAVLWEAKDAIWKFLWLLTGGTWA
ncbi:MAG TPA: site-2 protease family protein [Planctomycetes bacterium]|nr:site-2 protease family protein [Planctomycetota bacterium]HIL37296.1 site-2 protease family protein [Planctomycetota bacterium]